MSYSIPAIYNALDTFSPALTGMRISNSASDNQKALQACVDYAISQGGGIVLIPASDGTGASGPYKIQSADGTSATAAVTIVSSGPAVRLLFCGTGLGTQLDMHSSGDLFYLDNVNWMSFQDLDVSYHQSSGPFTGTAFHLTSCYGCELFRCKANNCQQAIVLDTNTLLAYMNQCSITYDTAYTGAILTGITINNATEIFISDCYVTSQILTSKITSTQTGVIIGDSSYVHLSDMQIENFYYGVQLGNNGNAANGSMLTNVRIACVDSTDSTCLLIVPDTYDARFIGCHFQSPSGHTNPTHNIKIDIKGQGAMSIDTVLFDTCTSRYSSDYGLEITGGQNIQVVGGEYAGNGSAGAGITVDGGAYNVQIVGANCVGEFQGSTKQLYGISITAGTTIQIVGVSCIGNDSSAGAGIAIGGTASDVTVTGAICNGPFKSGTPQAYGISVSGTPGTISIRNSKLTSNGSTGHGGFGLYVNLSSGATSTIYVSDCDLTGNNSAALSVSGTAPSKLEVLDCAGYNDLGTVLSGTVSSGGTIKNTSWGYYGPIEFYTSSTPGTVITQILVDTNDVHLTSGSFYLMPGETAQISYNPPAGTIHLLVVGK